MSDNIAWVDKNYKKYKMEDIENRHLKNILGFMCRGGGFVSFLDKDKITALFQEANDRGIKHGHDLQLALDSYEVKWLADVYNEIMEDEFRWGSD